MDARLARRLFGEDEAMMAIRICSRTCYRIWHGRTIKDKPGGIIVAEPGEIPFSYPDQARAPLPRRGRPPAAGGGGRAEPMSVDSREHDVKMSPKDESEPSPITAKSDLTSSGSSSSASVASPRITPYPDTPSVPFTIVEGTTYQLQAKSAVKSKPAPKKPLTAGKHFVQVKREDLTTWNVRSGDNFNASLGISLQYETRSGKSLEAIFVQRYVAEDGPERGMHTMQSTYRETPTMRVSGGWELAFSELMPGSVSANMMQIFLEFAQNLQRRRLTTCRSMQSTSGRD